MHAYSDPDILDRLNGNSANAGFNQWLGIRGVAAGNGQVEVEVPVREDMTQHHGYVHGGCVGALGDMACAWAASANGGVDVVTSNYSIHLLRPAVGSMLRAKARTVRKGRTTITTEAEIFAEAEGQEPKLIAKAMASIAVVGTR